MTRISLKQAIELGLNIGQDAKNKKAKYHSKKVTVDGIKFDSQKEANRYCELKLLKKAGKITNFELQPEFVLQEGFREKNGQWIRPIKYKADFRVIYADGSEVVIDTKGYKTKDYLIKRKMLLKKYPDIDFREE